MRKAYVWVLIFIIMLAAALAVKPAPDVQTGGKLLVGAIQVPYYLYNDTASKINVHVFNSSGYYLTNASTACIIHIYNNTGRHVVEATMTMDTNLIDYQYTLPATIMSVEGTHAYVIQCSNDDEAGFAAGELDILRGQSDVDSQSYIPVIAVLVVLIFATFMIGIGLKDDHFPLKLFLYWIGILLFIPLAQVGDTIAQAEYLPMSVLTMTNLFVYITIFMGIFASAYFMIYVLLKLLASAAVPKNMLRSG